MPHIKVCHMTSAHPPEDVRIFHKECVSLAEAGYNVYLVERGESYDKNGIHIIGVGKISGKRLKRMTAGAQNVYQTALKLDCDIYHIHDPELLPYALKLKRKGKKVIFDSHELTRVQILYKHYLPVWMLKIVSILYASYEDYVLKRLDGVIFPCPIKGQFPLPGKNRTFVNNVPRLSELYDQYNPNDRKDEATVCTIGSLAPNRGIKQLVLAANRAGCKVLLGGKILPREFEQELRTMPESKCVEFCGYLDRGQVIELYKRATISVSSILNVAQYNMAENLPTKVYESMAMGLPVILTRSPFNELMVQRYGFGVCVDPNDIAEFSATIRDLLDHPEKVAILGQNGRKTIRAEFNWELEQEKLIGLYKKLE